MLTLKSRSIKLYFRFFAECYFLSAILDQSSCILGFLSCCPCSMNHIKQGWCCLSKIINSHGSGVIDFSGNLVGKWKPNVISKMGLLGFKQDALIVYRRFGNSIRNENDVDHQFTRDFLVKLWVADRKSRNSGGNKRRKMVKRQSDEEKSFLQYPRLFSGSAVEDDKSVGKGKRVLKQPPLSQSVSDFLDPESPKEVNFCDYGICILCWYTTVCKLSL